MAVDAVCDQHPAKSEVSEDVLKVPAFLVELVCVRFENGERERVEREKVLSVLGLAVRLDDLAVDDDAGYFDLECPDVEVEQVAFAPASSQRHMPEVVFST